MTMRSTKTTCILLPVAMCRVAMFYKYLWGSQYRSNHSFSSTLVSVTSCQQLLREIMKFIRYTLEISLLLTVGMAITIEKRDSRNPAVSKKHDKRGLVGLGYGLQQDHPEHIYGHPEPAPIYEEPPPDALHPVPGHFEPAPASPTAPFLTHPVAAALPVPVPAAPHPLPQPVPVPVPVPVTKTLTVPVPVPVDRTVAVPVAVPVPKPYPVHIEKIVHVDRPVPIPIEKTVHVPIDRPVAVPVPVPKPYPVAYEKVVHVDRPYPVHVAVPYQVPKPYPVPVAVHARYKWHGCCDIAIIDENLQRSIMELIKKLGIGGGVLFFLGITFGWMGFPALLKSQIKSAIALKEGSEMREMWSKFPLPLDFKIYLFNVTNPKEIAEGGKPIVNEVGPFFYDEYKEKVDLVDREEDDSVEYSLKATWYFNPSKSNGLTGEEELVLPHLLILAMVVTTMREKPSAMGILNKAVDSIFKKPDSIFVKVKAREILFDGLPVDCTVKDFAGSAVCSILKSEGKDLVNDGDNRYKFSIFGAKNGTILPERLRVLRGIKNFKDVGRVLEWDKKPALTMWSADHCNQFNGTDSTIFPPLMTKEDDIVSFSPDICRSLGARFSHETKVKGVNTYHYTADFGDMSTNPLEKCFCPTPETCLSKNLFDLTKCVGAPLIASLPHFYLADEKYIQEVGGLHPQQELHDISMDFEPMTATPLSAHKRLQFNIQVQPIEKFKLMKKFPEVLFPLFWVEEGILLDDQFVKKVKVVFTAISVVGFIKWLMVLGGMGLGGTAAGMHYKRKQTENKLDITKVTPQSDSRKDSSNEKKLQTLNISTIQAAAVPPSLDRY
ncbi:sensory neuron membrane protein 1-like [Vespula squamosa]|uniref:Sensory neuron membrane protein 1-like n=1 Tax=Vespula squamosa TaxID=30214 RepID=A0ABD2A8B2_VESSQ